MMRATTVDGRDRQYKIDGFVDFMSTAAPVCIIWFGYNVPISIEEMLSMTILPSFLLMLKLSTMFEEIIRSRSAKRFKFQTEYVQRRGRRRRSIFGGKFSFEVVKQQESSVPYFVHFGAGVTKIMFGILFFVVAIFQLTTHVTGCEMVLWNSCEVKTPFCGNIFNPTCNCAVLKVVEHNYTRLPEKSIKQMSALKRMKISHGPLQYIFSDFSKAFEKLSKVDLSYNMVKEIPDTFGMNMKFFDVILSNNNLTSIPASCGNPYLRMLELDNNNITDISPVIRNAQNLQELYVSNNNLSGLPAELFINTETQVTPMLNSLYVYGNRLKEYHVKYNMQQI